MRRSPPCSDLGVDDMAPEEWLLRLYPHEGVVDPMAGGPRRIAGAGGLSRQPGSPWLTAVQGFGTSGWSGALAGSHGFYLAELALLTAKFPLTRLELASSMARWMLPWKVGGPDAESIEVPTRPSASSQADPLAALSGADHIATIGDAIDALVSIGLLLIEERAGKHLLLPNPSPQPAWERIGLVDAPLRWARTNALGREHARAASTIVSAVSWLRDDGLKATPRSMAIRWSTTVEDIVGGIRMLGGSGRIDSDRPLGFDLELNPDETIVLWRTAVP